jgi:uncharacterized protein (TIGR02271 family)
MADEQRDVDRNEKIGEGVGGVTGAAAGAAIGSLAGPIGTAIGAIAGAVGGWWIGRAASDAATNIDATDDAYFRQRFAAAGGRDYDRARPAFHLGYIAGMNPEYEDRPFDEVEPDLRAGWTGDFVNRFGDWNDVRGFARDAYEHGRERRLTLAEEQLAVGKRTVQEGEVAVRKHVDTRHVETEVELAREEVTIERRPLRADAATVSEIGEEEIRVPVMREEPVVEKHTVPVEEVVVRKEAVPNKQKVAAELRKETLDVDKDVDATRERTTQSVDETNERLYTAGRGARGTALALVAPCATHLAARTPTLSEGSHVAEIPIQRKEGRNIWPVLLGLLVLVALLWFLFGRRNTTATARARADSAAVASGAVTNESAAGTTANNVAAGTAGAAAAANNAMGTTGSPALADADIANVIHEVNAGEIAAGRMAETKASNADVKSFAREMVRAHSALDSKGPKIVGTSAAVNTAIRDSVVSANKAMSSQLESASGAAFDKAYVDGQVTGHQNALGFLQQAQNQAQSADLKKTIDAAIPDVQKHLDRARALQSKLGQ